MMNKSLTALVLVVLLASAAVMGAAAEDGVKPAELYVEQESYIESPVETVEEDGNRVYQASGAEVDLAPRNFAAGDVIDHGVRGDVGSLSFDEDTERWTLDPEGTDGSYHVWFVVREEVEVEETVVDEETGEEETVTEVREVETRYEAVVSLSQTSIVTMDSDEVDELDEDASRWQEWEREVASLFGEDRVEKYTESAYAFLVFLDNPLAYFTGGYVSTLIMMVTTPGGIMVALTFASLFLALAWGYIKYGTMRAARDAARERLDDVKQDLEEQALGQSMAMVSLHSVYSDDNTAEIMSDALDSTNLKDAWDSYASHIASHGEVLADRLACMDEDGFVAVEEGDGPRVVEESKADGSTKPLTELSEEEILEVQDDDAVERYNLADSDARPDDLNIDIDELNERLGEQTTSVREKEQRAERLLELVSHVRRHEHTDHDGRVLPVRELLETMMQVTTEAEKYDGAMARYHLEELLYLLNHHSVSDEAQALIEETRAGDLDNEGGAA